jgi:cytochrome c biogenesis protein CcmG/thiol:disulfide interchange protein DsbE
MRTAWWVAAGMVAAVALAAGGCASHRTPATMLDGPPVDLSALRGKPLVLNFWATWCPPCRWEMPDLERAYRQYRGRGVQFLAVALDDADEVRAFVKENKITLPVAVDEDRVLARDYGVANIPTTYFLNSDGTVAHKQVGALDLEGFRAAIETLR